MKLWIFDDIDISGITAGSSLYIAGLLLSGSPPPANMTVGFVFAVYGGYTIGRLCMTIHKLKAEKQDFYAELERQ